MRTTRRCLIRSPRKTYVQPLVSRRRQYSNSQFMDCPHVTQPASSDTLSMWRGRLATRQLVQLLTPIAATPGRTHAARPCNPSLRTTGRGQSLSYFCRGFVRGFPAIAALGLVNILELRSCEPRYRNHLQNGRRSPRGIDTVSPWVGRLSVCCAHLAADRGKEGSASPYLSSSV